MRKAQFARNTGGVLVDVPILEGPVYMKSLAKGKMFLIEGKKDLEKHFIFQIIRCLILFLDDS